MKKEEKLMDCKEKFFSKKHHNYNHGSSNVIYGLGIIGALFYFLQNADTFVSAIVGIVKAIFWPAILMFKLLTYLKL